MKLYKFRALGTCENLNRVKDIINSGFYCNDIFGFNDMNEGVYANNPKNGSVTLSEKQKYKICSFSGIKALKSELMWGHYANAGKGIIIEVDVENCDSIKEVNYNDNLNTIEEILTNKSKEWKYEDEYRYLSTDDLDENEVRIGNIVKIHFGTPYKNLTNYDEIKAENKQLKEYLALKKKLTILCTDKKIDYEDFKFI